MRRKHAKGQGEGCPEGCVKEEDAHRGSRQRGQEAFSHTKGKPCNACSFLRGGRLAVPVVRGGAGVEENRGEVHDSMGGERLGGRTPFLKDPLYLDLTTVISKCKPKSIALALIQRPHHKQP
jgi:hypothetical protein